MDVTRACHCCLRYSPDKDLTMPYTHLGKTEIYADMIKESFDIQLVVGGSGSCGICSACVGRLRDASDFKLQVQRSQAELQARLQGASRVKEEESAVEDPEMQDGDGTSEPVSDDMLRLNMAAGDGASDEGEPLLHEELIIKPESNEDETSDEMSLEERAVKSESSDAASDEDCVSVSSDGSAARAVRTAAPPARTTEQLAMACSVVLERLRDDAEVHIHSGTLAHRTAAVMDVTRACRCCLRCAPDKDLTTPYTHLGKPEIYADMLKESFDIHLVLDGSDSCGICSVCVGRLRDASDFKLQVQRSQAELQARLQGVSHVKEEESAVESENPEMQDEEGPGDTVSDEEFIIKPETVDEDEMSLCSDGSAARVREQLAMACYVVLERLRGDAIVHKGDKTYDCEYCGDNFRNKSILNNHIQNTHLLTGPTPFACDFCSSTFQTKFLIIEHEKSEHCVKNFMCAECEYTTSSKKSLETHLKSHSVKNNFNCSRCSYTSSCKSNLHKHQTIHMAGKPFQCSNCDFKYNQKSELRTHHRIHTGEKPFKCSHCDYKCSNRSGLRRHERTHTGEKPFQCSHCDYKFTQKLSLQRHIRIHTGEKPYKCSHCDYKCSLSSSLRIHERTHTGEKPFQCSHCDYKSNQKSHLNIHQRIHTGEKPYKCSHCDYKCSRSSSLRKHERTHTGEKPFHCSHCDYKCSRKSNLKTHQTIHTRQKPFKCK
ncbi:zinc finger protein 436-like [Cydia splendana]|uniref:zinc finger protein 436-like n=1 Tax=Cydia splendana TaxID=1100963 RepID=UPI00300DB190